MNERLLQFIWQYRLYTAACLHTTSGDPLRIIRPGQLNHDQGPDFLNAYIRIRDTLWAGNIELHVRSSDWLRHGHDADSRYRNIVLHVVWQDDADLRSRFPVLELQPLVPGWLISRYRQLMDDMQVLPCRPLQPRLDHLQWEHWKSRLLAERLHDKSQRVLRLLRESGRHWEETAWRFLASGFGIPVNADAFADLAATIPLALLLRQRGNLLALEALLIGQAGLLRREEMDDYTRQLWKEYQYQKKKYRLPAPRLPVQLLRMRPAAFPAPRLAQLAMLLHTRGPVFSWLRADGKVEDLLECLQVKASAYWDQHYRPGVASDPEVKQVGRSMAENLVINILAPLLYACGLERQQPELCETAVDWLESLPAESNRITRLYKTLQWELPDAASTQALQRLYQHYCRERRCLECAVGAALLGREVPPDQL